MCDSKGLDNRICKELILELLRSRPSSRLEVLNAIDHALPGALSAKQKGERVSYLLQILRKQGRFTQKVLLRLLSGIFKSRWLFSWLSAEAN